MTTDHRTRDSIQNDHSRRVTLRFDRLTDGTLVAVHQGVAAIVHPLNPLAVGAGANDYRWTLAGDGLAGLDERPRGATPYVMLSTAHAAEALGVHLGVTVDGYEALLA